MSNHKQLTKAEEEIMQYFWSLGSGSVTEIISQMEDPKPPHSSVSTIVRILEKKGFLDHRSVGRTFEYFPLISKEDYSNQSLNKFVNDYFEGSYSGLVSFIAKEKDIDMDEVSELLEILNRKN